jgi:hypothetical protein
MAHACIRGAPNKSVKKDAKRGVERTDFSTRDPHAGASGGLFIREPADNRRDRFRLDPIIRSRQNATPDAPGGFRRPIRQHGGAHDF